MEDICKLLWGWGFRILVGKPHGKAYGEMDNVGF